MAEGRAAAAISRLGQLTREMNDRRALRERNAAKHKEAAKERLQLQGKVAERASQHLAELNRRQKKAGGWATANSLAKKQKVLGFEPEDDDSRQEEPFRGYPVPSTSAQPVPPSAPKDQPAERPAPERKFSRSVAPKEPPAEPEKKPKPKPAPRPTRHRQEESFDDEDFSNVRWMR